MTIQRHPQYLPKHLEQTYQVLLSFAENGKVNATPRQVVEALGLASPAPLFKRLIRLNRMGVICYQG